MINDIEIIKRALDFVLCISKIFVVMNRNARLWRCAMREIFLSVCFCSFLVTCELVNCELVKGCVRKCVTVSSPNFLTSGTSNFELILSNME